jgi:NAD(P)-dependent dehydrogenase (short-subunit alcohol dehydrogenase family)
MRFQDKICLVTGGTSGIGRATCLQLAAEGAQVIVLGRSPEQGREVVQHIKKAGGRARFLRCDLARPRSVTAAVSQVRQREGRLDVLVSNAAMMTFEPLVELPAASWDTLMQVNLRALFQLCQGLLPLMPRGSAIVCVSSVHAHETTARVVPYATSKGATEAFVRGLSRELDPAQCRINAVAPGAVDTPMLWDNPNVKSGAEKIDGPVGKPEDIAAAICFLAAPEARFIHGTTLVVDGGRLDQL